MSKAPPPGAGASWRWLRRASQLLLPLAVLLTPLLGGWQRLDRNSLTAWEGHGWDLPQWIMQRLPLGDAPSRAYEAIEVTGGGTAADYVGVPVVDPLAGVLALMAGPELGTRSFIGLVVVLAVAGLTGRAFCGWFCPFGTLARGIEMLIERLPFKPPRFELPQRRPLRFVLLGASLVLGALGSHVLLIFTLPHALVQQAGYGAWLMGGAGAALGALAGLVVAGIVVGPTAYCATLCPTGASLSLLGRRRPVRLSIVQPARCGTHCDLCDHACWLSLKPSTGNPGPDCDACGRCTEVCPHDNLGVGLKTRLRKPAAVAVLLAALAWSPTTHAAPEDGAFKPALLLEGRRTVEDVDLVVSIVDLHAVELDTDAGNPLGVVEVSAFLARGPSDEVDSLGRSGPRDVYNGPLRVVVTAANGEAHQLDFERPTDPLSTPNRSIYRQRVPVQLEPGSTLIVEPIPGWTTQPQAWEVPNRGSAGPMRALGFFGGAVLAFGGLLALALAVPSPTSREPKAQ